MRSYQANTPEGATIKHLVTALRTFMPFDRDGLCGPLPNEVHHAGILTEVLQIQIQIRTCRARRTNCPPVLTKYQKAMRNR